MRVIHSAYLQLVGLPTFQARISNFFFFFFFRYNCGVNIGCRPHELQTDLSLKMYFSTLAFNNLKFFCYNTIILQLIIIKGFYIGRLKSL
jgi:hypothetical protein